MNLGQEIVTELGRRGQTGQFFDYAGYQQLKLVKDGESLSRFLQQNGYVSPPSMETATEAVEYLFAVSRKMAREETPWFVAAMLIGLISPFSDVFFWVALLIFQHSRKAHKGL